MEAGTVIREPWKLKGGNREPGTAETELREHGTNNCTGFYRSRIPDPGSRSSSGFTLLELLVVIVILSMTAIIVVPRLPAAEGMELKTSARALASALRYLEERSVAGKINYRLHLDISANTIAITRRLANGDEAPPDDSLLARKILGSRIAIVDVNTPRLGKVTDGEVLIDFSAAGLTDCLTIHLASPSGETYTVTAFPANGRVRVRDGYQELAL